MDIFKGPFCTNLGHVLLLQRDLYVRVLMVPSCDSSGSGDISCQLHTFTPQLRRVATRFDEKEKDELLRSE